MRYNVSRGAFLKKMHEREGAIVIQVNDTLICYYEITKPGIVGRAVSVQ